LIPSLVYLESWNDTSTSTKGATSWFTKPRLYNISKIILILNCPNIKVTFTGCLGKSSWFIKNSGSFKLTTFNLTMLGMEKNDRSFKLIKIAFFRVYLRQDIFPIIISRASCVGYNPSFVWRSISNAKFLVVRLFLFWRNLGLRMELAFR
jgi:hypothetical protein